ncbi:MAG TPA: IS4 family transposase [Anaerolineales bacterium]|nr:IS4 family transposase [Anaerolineales bacterium]
MPINETYRTWIRRICELRPKQRKTQVQNFVWLLAGIFHSRSVSLSKIAGKVISTAKNVSTVRRLSRFLASSAVDVRSWYRSTAKAWLMSQAHQVGEIRLIVDGSKVGFGHQLLMISLAYRRRAVPIAWAWVRHVRGHSTATKQVVLLKYVRSLIPQNMPVFLVGDSEFGSIAVLQQLKQWQWFFVLRQKGNTGLWLDERIGWQRLDGLVQQAGQSAWYPNGYLTQSDIFPVSVLIYWQKGEKQPWCLATNLPDAALTLRYYRRRMWIEEMFADFKKHGFDLESTMLRNPPRLSRLTLAVAFLYVWLLSIGSRTIRAGFRHLVDRKDRRDLSIFQIGLRFIDRKLLHLLSFSIPLCRYS